MPVPLLGLLLRGAMSAAGGTTRIAAMSGGAGRGAIGSMTRGALARRALHRGQDVPRMDTPEMQVLRKRITSPIASAEQRQGDRSKLAGMLMSQRHERRRVKNLSDPKRIDKFAQGIEKSTFLLGKFGLRTVGMTAGVVGAAAGLNRLATASNESAISTLRTLSPAMAAIAARRDLFDMKQGVLRGEHTAGSAKNRELARQRKDKATQKIRIFGENTWNEFIANKDNAIAVLFEWGEKIGLVKAITNYNDGAFKNLEGRGTVLKTLDQILTNGLHNDPNLMNRRPNEKPGGRM